jgi:hypothetical protein
MILPITAVVADTYLKGKRLGGGQSGGDVRKLAAELERIKAENAQLKERMHNVETIVTSRDYDALPPPDDEYSIAKKAEILSKQIEKNNG